MKGPKPYHWAVGDKVVKKRHAILGAEIGEPYDLGARVYLADAYSKGVAQYIVDAVNEKIDRDRKLIALVETKERE